MDNCKICKVPFRRIELTVAGEVYPCCPLYIKDYSFGNINENTLEEIWNSEKAINFRQHLLKGDYSFCDLRLCNPNKNPSGLQLDALSEQGYELSEIMENPKHVKLSHDRECNIMCTTCRDGIHRNSDKELEALNKKIDTVYLPMLNNAEIVCLSGSGDPFASRHGQKLIKAIVEEYPKIRFDVHTNGILCSQSMCTKLGIENKLSTIQISMHAATKETYDQIALGGNFDKIIENLEWLSEMKKSGKLFDIHLFFVIQLTNYKEMAEFVKLAQKYHAKAFFWDYRDWGTRLGEHYDELAVFNPENIEHENFIRLITQDIFKSKNCYMNPMLDRFSKIHNVEEYITLNRVNVEMLKRFEAKTQKQLGLLANLPQNLAKEFGSYLYWKFTFGKKRKYNKLKYNKLKKEIEDAKKIGEFT